MAGEVVRIRNVGDKAFSDSYAAIRYTIPPGQERIVPDEAMKLWMGDAELVDLDERRRPRTEEFQRLCVMYGVYENQDLFDSVRPRIEAFDIDGKRITTLFEDPLGYEVTPEVATRAENQLMQERMMKMERELAALRAQRDIDERASLAVKVSDAQGDRGPQTSPPPMPTIPPAAPPHPPSPLDDPIFDRDGDGHIDGPFNPDTDDDAIMEDGPDIVRVRGGSR